MRTLVACLERLRRGELPDDLEPVYGADVVREAERQIRWQQEQFAVRQAP